MGYESKFYACRDYGFKWSDEKYNASEIVASLDVSKMGYSDTVTVFLNLFSIEAPFGIYLPDYDEETEMEKMMYVHEDKYGAPLCYLSDIDEAITLAIQMYNEDRYWRFKLLIKFLEAFKDEEDIYIVHYGY